MGEVPDTMRAVVLHAPGELVVAEVAVPECLPGQILTRVGACGICGSDLRYLAGENPWAKHTLGEETPNPPDMILGHEIGATLVTDAERRVGLMAFKTCGKCRYCRTGRSNLCPNTAHLGHGAGWEGQNPGGMAEYCPVWETHLFDLPDHISLEEATFLDGLGVAVNAVNRTEIFPGSHVAVLGAGPIGLSIAQVAKARGAGVVAVTDVYEAPVRCAEELGLGPCLNVSVMDEAATREALMDAAGGQKYVAVFDTTGSAQVQQVALKCLDRGGTLVAMAGVTAGLRLDESSLAGERRLTTCSNNFAEDYQEGLELLAGGVVTVRPMITHRFPLAEARNAFDTARRKHETGAIKVILLP
ncbi:MAG: alcohol dehydrogenase catalytic domain-containing protein [Armatimonadota bacterium]